MTAFKLTALALIVVGAFATTVGQMAPDAAPVVIGGSAAALPAPGQKAGMVTMRVEDTDVEPAKDAPFCATITTEHNQTFADGNRIHTSDNSTLCRDSEGRTRREATLNLLGAAQAGSVPKLITIVDPIAGYRYMLDSENKIAHKVPLPSARMSKKGTVNVMGEGPDVAKGEQVMIFHQRVGTTGPNMIMNDDMFFKKAGQASDEPAPATESLGDQTIDGIHATGTRITTTIPAGKMGNEQPILVTSERWYSPELKATVMTTHNDPWAGELKTEFTNVNASEPDPSLFTVPSGYKLVDEKAGPFTLQKRVLATPPAQ